MCVGERQLHGAERYRVFAEPGQPELWRDQRQRPDAGFDRLQQQRPALLTSAVLNTIYVFNSFPIIWVITGKLPGDQTDTTVTFIFREVNTINGAVNSYWAIIAVNAAFNLAFSIWILNGYLASIPTELEDAALVDGAGPLRTMLRIVLPLARPGLVTAVIFTFIQVWNEFVVAETIFNDPTSNRETLTVGINAFVGLYQTQYQYLFVASIIGVVPVVLLFATIERYLVGGLTAGSIR